MNNFQTIYYAFIMNRSIHILADLIFHKKKLKFSRAVKNELT